MTLPKINENIFTFKVNLVKVAKTAMTIYAVLSIVYTTYSLVGYFKTHEVSVSEKLVSPLVSSK